MAMAGWCGDGYGVRGAWGRATTQPFTCSLARPVHHFPAIEAGERGLTIQFVNPTSSRSSASVIPPIPAPTMSTDGMNFVLIVCAAVNGERVLGGICVPSGIASSSLQTRNE